MTNPDKPIHIAFGDYGSTDSMTIREHFSSLAMQGILSSKPINSATTLNEIVECSVNAADALILELNKSKS